MCALREIASRWQSDVEISYIDNNFQDEADNTVNKFIKNTYLN
jgi:cell division protein FtsX